MKCVAKLAEELQSKPFVHVEEEAMLSIIRTADVLMQGASQFLKQFEISVPQYNALRILRGSQKGLSCGSVGERMVSRDPDITRLLDRLESRGLIERERNGQDRRVVMTNITAEGAKLLDRIKPLIVAEHRRRLGGLGEAKLRQLIELLEQARETA